MSKRIRRNWAFIHLLLDSPSVKQRKTVVKTATEDQFKALAEIVANTLAGGLPLSPRERNKLLKNKTILRRISCKTTPEIKRQKLILKHIGVIEKLLAFVKPALHLIKP